MEEVCRHLVGAFDENGNMPVCYEKVDQLLDVLHEISHGVDIADTLRCATTFWILSDLKHNIYHQGKVSCSYD